MLNPHQRDRDYPIVSNPSGIPISLRSPSKSLEGWPFERPGACWECGAPIQSTGAYQYCGGCRASMRQQAREDARPDREED